MKFNKSLQSEIDLLDEEVQEMVEMLSSDDEGDRLVAAVNLQQECDEDTIPFLIHALEDSSSSVQLIAVTTLWEMANAKAVLPLLECINSKRDKKVSDEACSALKELINQDHLLKLLDYLESDDELQIIYVLILLRKIHDVQALPSISPYLSSENKNIRKEAVITLRYLNQLTWEVRRNAAIALEMHEDNSSSKSLSSAISDLHWQVRKFSMRALNKVLSEEYLGEIVKLLCDDYSDVRKEAAIALGLLGSKKAIPSLKQSLDDADIEVRIQSQKALEKLNV